MDRRDFLLQTTVASAALVSGCATSSAVNHDTRCYELRVYSIAPGKQEALLNRFRDHTLALFAKHGIESVGYWLPVNAEDQRLFFLLRYPNRAAREASWKAFSADPDWQAAHKASEANGPLVTQVENPFLVVTDYSPVVRTGDVSHGGVFEWRTYTTPPGLLPHLDARFRDRTMALFAKHGMHNYAYFHKMADQPAADVSLWYFLTHDSEAAAKASFEAFRQDPAWIAARTASERAAGGSLTVPNGVRSLFLRPTDFSPTR
ncbi:MAG: NIPSNAP family protein [Verrucomicrobia bacterium]|nr:NIPSNAP family protein [Verrucomicrobiota bacterium]